MKNDNPTIYSPDLKKIEINTDIPIDFPIFEKVGILNFDGTMAYSLTKVI